MNILPKQEVVRSSGVRARQPYVKFNTNRATISIMREAFAHIMANGLAEVGMFATVGCAEQKDGTYKPAAETFVNLETKEARTFSSQTLVLVVPTAATSPIYGNCYVMAKTSAAIDGINPRAITSKGHLDDLVKKGWVAQQEAIRYIFKRNEAGEIIEETPTVEEKCNGVAVYRLDPTPYGKLVDGVNADEFRFYVLSPVGFENPRNELAADAESTSAQAADVEDIDNDKFDD